MWHGVAAYTQPRSDGGRASPSDGGGDTPSHRRRRRETDVNAAADQDTTTNADSSAAPNGHRRAIPYRYGRAGRASDGDPGGDTHQSARGHGGSAAGSFRAPDCRAHANAG